MMQFYELNEVQPSEQKTEDKEDSGQEKNEKMRIITH